MVIRWVTVCSEDGHGRYGAQCDWWSLGGLLFVQRMGTGDMGPSVTDGH